MVLFTKLDLAVIVIHSVDIVGCISELGSLRTSYLDSENCPSCSLLRLNVEIEGGRC
jgi:hypothetical protein